MANETEGAPSRQGHPKPVVSGGVDPSLAPRLSASLGLRVLTQISL